MNNGLVTSLNKLRELSSDLYHKYIPEITSDTDISALSTPIFQFPEVYNEFCSVLLNKLVYSQFEVKSFRNPFVVLDGDSLPLGYCGEHIYVNPTKGRQYNPEDFAGLLIKYEADVKVQYQTINSDTQYVVTFSREQLKKAFTSWGDLERFIDGLSNSLYNGAFIDEYNKVKELIAGAYDMNIAQYTKVSAVTSQAAAQAFAVKARELFLNFQSPSSSYNSWAKNGGEGRPVISWTRPEDIVFIVRNDIRAYLDVMVEALSYNIDKATLLGNIMTVDNFDVYNDDGTLHYDGSDILGIIADKAFFKIRRQDMFLETFYNPNNRSAQYYLNNIKMYGISMFANHMVIALDDPEVAPTAIKSDVTSVEVTVGSTAEVKFETVPFAANGTITYSDGGSGEFFTVAAKTGDPKTAVLTGVKAGTNKTLTASATNPDGETINKTVTVKVVAA
jgi:hypothetical protein